MAVSRRTVTVLFADVVDSTPLGERLDPEALRRVMTRWYERAHTTITRHGGVVEKFIGDAVMGVFGIPEAHEDDAPRAVRAAGELREELSRLNDEFERDFGVHVSMRVGVNTGEVVAGDPSRGHSFVSGDAVVLVGRCLPYGEGITFWPLTEILRDVGIGEALAPLLGDEADLVLERLSAITRGTSRTRRSEEHTS